jgi:hypothetical protein
MLGQRDPERFVEIGDGDPDASAPSFGLVGEPSLQFRALAALDHVDHAAVSNIADGAGPPGRFAPVCGQELRLVHPHRRSLGDPVGVGDERLAPPGDGVHDGVPGDVELAGGIGDGMDLGADLASGPQTRLGRQHGTWRCDVRPLFGPGLRLARGFPARPAALDPHQTHWRAERWQIRELHPGPVLERRPDPALSAGHQLLGRLDRDMQPPLAVPRDLEHPHALQSQQQLGPARTVQPQRGPPPRSLA